MDRATSYHFSAPAMPQGLATALAARGFGHVAEDWTPLVGGRTNLVWRLGNAKMDVVCKLYRGAGTVVFPNNPAAEHDALAALAGTDLAPALRDRLNWGGETCLVYRFVSGRTNAAGAVETLHALAVLHRNVPPAGLRRAAIDTGTFIDQGRAMLRDASAADLARLRAAPPVPSDLGRGAAAFLHGDPVPSNVVARPEGGITFIDWQCPALGDPVHDISLALSPSMRLASGLKPLSPGATTLALNAYGDAKVVRRYLGWRPVLSWRLACHAAWRLARGDEAYRAGLDAELALAERLDQQDDERHAARADGDHGGAFRPFRK